ncbi:MAG: hypothetical protein ACYC5U_08810 [Rhodocyclaceae bacterium]
MQEDARRMMIDRTESVAGFDVASSVVLISVSTANQRALPSPPLLANPRLTRSPILPQIKGWPGKALEFINSGPPALLNNPCCSKRVVYFPFLKHAMEVHYG